MLLADLVAASREAASTRARNAKVHAFASLLRRLDPGEAGPAVALVAGEARQGRIGLGWATLAAVDVPPAGSPTLTILDLDAAIDEVAAATGPGSVAERRRIVSGLLARATADEAAFVRAIFTGGLRQGALEGVAVEALAKAATVPAPAVRRALMPCGSLSHTASAAMTDGEPGLRAIRLEVMRPVQPMLASPADDAASAMHGVAAASVEVKVDGVRLQAHRRGRDVALFTRNLNDVTARLPDVVARVAGMPGGDLVLDGEVAGMDGDDPDAFQDTMSRVGRRDGGDGLRAFFFDCLYADGDLVDRPLSERSAVLRGMAGESCIEAAVATGAAEVEAFYRRAVAAGHEGVVVKDLASPYHAGRRGRAWRKLKPVRTFDLVVLGAEWGHGRRRGWLSNLHLGARDPSSGGFVMVGKTFKGLTDDLLRWQTRELRARETSTRGIAVFVRPELVVEIELDGVQASRRYPGGIALRFARVVRYRADRDAATADTLDALRALLHRSKA